MLAAPLWARGLRSVYAVAAGTPRPGLRHARRGKVRPRHVFVNGCRAAGAHPACGRALAGQRAWLTRSSTFLCARASAQPVPHTRVSAPLPADPRGVPAPALTTRGARPARCMQCPRRHHTAAAAPAAGLWWRGSGGHALAHPRPHGGRALTTQPAAASSTDQSGSVDIGQQVIEPIRANMESHVLGQVRRTRARTCNSAAGPGVRGQSRRRRVCVRVRAKEGEGSSRSVHWQRVWPWSNPVQRNAPCRPPRRPYGAY